MINLKHLDIIILKIDSSLEAISNQKYFIVFVFVVVVVGTDVDVDVGVVYSNECCCCLTVECKFIIVY